MLPTGNNAYCLLLGECRNACGDGCYERPYRCGSQIGKKNERKKSLECVLRVCVCIEKGSYIYACNIFKKAVFNFLHIVNQYKHAHILKLK